MKPAAIVTGASSGIGREISRILLQKEYQVFGFGRDFGEECLERENPHFQPICCDLLDTTVLTEKIKEIRRSWDIAVLVNNAGVAYYGLHEELNVHKIQTMVRTNLEVPLVLTNLLLRDLKKQRGFIINISSVTAQQSNPHGCVYGATKAALSGFSKSLFDETRKYGVRVINIQPDMTKTSLYRNADFSQGEEEESYLHPQEVADAVEYALNQREGMVVTEITLRPQVHRIRRKSSCNSRPYRNKK